jgi:hypothetical protein
METLSNGSVLPTGTIKKCNPFLDAFQTGYTIKSPCDIEFTFSEIEGYIYRWRVNNFVPMSNHLPDQFSEELLNTKFAETAYKWHFNYVIKTPPGYSSLFTHPLNRSDLPFMTLSGVVDTDTYPLSVNLPFLLYKFEGSSLVIPEGTPIAQVIPIKRDDWKNSVEEYNENETKKNEFELTKHLVHSYKNKWWHRKSYN